MSELYKKSHLNIPIVGNWILCSESLPPVRQYKTGIITNEDLVIIKWYKHGSYEFAVLTKTCCGTLMWEIPDYGYVEISEVSQWLSIPPCL